jgi:hypothetical protein
MQRHTSRSVGLELERLAMSIGQSTTKLSSGLPMHNREACETLSQQAQVSSSPLPVVEGMPKQSFNPPSERTCPWCILCKYLSNSLSMQLNETFSQMLRG